MDLSNTVTTVGLGGNVNFWNLETGESLGTISYGSPLVDVLKFNDTTLCASSKNGKIAVFDVTSKTLTKELEGHNAEKGGVAGMCILPEGRIASGGSDATCRIWKLDAPPGQELTKTLNAHKKTVSAVSYFPGTKFLYTASCDETVHIWDLEGDGEEEEEEEEEEGAPGISPVGVYEDHCNAITCMDIAPRAGLLFTSGFDSGIQINDLNAPMLPKQEETEEEEEEGEGEKKKKSNLNMDPEIFRFGVGMLAPKPFEPIYCLKVVEEKSLLVTGSVHGEICIYDFRRIDDHQAVHKFENIHDQYVMSIDRIDGERFVSCGFGDNTVKVWSVTEPSTPPRSMVCEAPQFGACYMGKNVSPYVLPAEEATYDIDLEEDCAIKKENILATESLQFRNNLKSCWAEGIQEKEMKIPIEVDHRLVNEIFFARPKFKLAFKSCLDYFVMFQFLKLRERSYLICKHLEGDGRTKPTVDELLELYERSMKILEETEEEGEEVKYNGFVSAFTMAVFNQLKDQEEDLLKNEGIVQKLEELGIKESLASYVVQPLNEHPSLHLRGDNLPEDFLDAFRRHMKKLYKARRYNYLIRSSSGGLYPAHLDLLIYKSNFFYRMLHFEGAETRITARREITIRYLPPNAVALFLQDIYLETVTSSDVSALLALANFAEVYSEVLLLQNIIKRMKALSDEKKKEGEEVWNAFVREVLACPNFQSDIEAKLKSYWALHMKLANEEVEAIREEVVVRTPKKDPVFEVEFDKY